MKNTLLFLGLLICCGIAMAQTPGPESNQPNALIPAPQVVDFDGGGIFIATSRTPIIVPGGAPEALRIAEFVSTLIGPGVGVSHPDSLAIKPVVEIGPSRPGSIVLLLSANGDTSNQEGYSLRVDPTGITVQAETAAGLFYGVQTLRQLMSPEVEYTAARIDALEIPAVKITDAPRYPWRGAMLDIARHFFGVDAIERYIDLMALYKLNILHLHLSDDQGWRIEIPGWERLTTVGSLSQVGGGTGGFLSTADYEHLVTYAADRFITIVPEIDVPGHTHAALVSYPNLSCDGKPREAYTGIRVGFSALCVESETTYRFLDDVVREIGASTSGPWFHIGGDEVETLTEEEYATFVQRVEEILIRHGKQMVGWDEIASVKLTSKPLLQLWRPFWDDLQHDDPARRENAASRAATVEQAIGRGARVILSPADRIYLDMKYDPSTALGLAWAGYNSVRDAYDWGETPWLDSLPEGAIAGIEAPLWTETISTIAEMEAMVLPRLPGVAERGWSSKEAINWESYKPRLAAQAPRWFVLGYNFTRSEEVWTQ